ncbi:hypothetical protein PV779_41240 [Streptomyces sp. ID01-9D]|nr:hypothetical protein [Streptomyces sp. ID01-9D]
MTAAAAVTAAVDLVGSTARGRTSESTGYCSRADMTRPGCGKGSPRLILPGTDEVMPLPGGRLLWASQVKEQDIHSIAPFVV